MTNFEEKLKKFDYTYPSVLIAQKPASPRDSAKLLIYQQNQETKFDSFKNLGKYLPKNSILVFNETKVIPARLNVVKQTGGKAQLLYIGKQNNLIKVLADRKLKVNSELKLTNEFKFSIKAQENQFYLLEPNFSISEVENILNKFGITPLPPYIKNSPLTEKQKRLEYQAVFAKKGDSVAAPTASLHFTRNLLNNLKKQGIEQKFVRLDVGLGTFAPLKEENIKNKKLHKEYFYIEQNVANFLNQAKKENRLIIAVGTTVTRTLESAVNKKTGLLERLSGETDLFITENSKINFVNGIITNFHVPKSSLLMLVSAFIGRSKLLDTYKKAIKNNFRLFSFGDAMLILPKNGLFKRFINKMVKK